MCSQMAPAQQDPWNQTLPAVLSALRPGTISLSHMAQTANVKRM